MSVTLAMPGTQAVSFELSPARHGWIGMTVRAGGEVAEIACSQVYDPFPDLVEWLTRATCGLCGCCEVDEEGTTAILRLDLEPGALRARLRIYSPDEHGGVEASRLDVPVDVVQLAKAWVDAFVPYVASYDPEHWTLVFEGDDPPVRRTLADISLHGIGYQLRLLGLVPLDDGDLLDDGFQQRAADFRARYAAACGAAT